MTGLHALLRFGSSVLRLAVASAILLATLQRAAACDTPPAPVRDLDIPPFYADPKSSVIEPGQRARHDGAVEPLKRFLDHVAADADRSWRDVDPAAKRASATCALAWITAWAAGEAWLGRMANPQSEYQRKWDLAGAALAYLKVRTHASTAERAVVEPWLQRFADLAHAFFDDPRHRRNNHWYWLGLGIGGVALATDSERHWLIARAVMHDAARDIQADGTLPLELARGGRAIHYHAFAVMPLVALAELARARAEDFYAIGDGALHRLVDATLAGLADPAIFDQRAGVPQQRPVAVAAGAGWLHLYALRHADRLTSPRPDMAKGHRWLGGDALVLDGMLSRRGSP